jgi:dipeptidase E
MPGLIVAMGGGAVLRRDAPLENELLRLAGGSEPRVCYLNTASAHDPARIARFFEAFVERPCRPYDVELFGVPEDPLDRLAEADVVYVSGGNTVNMLAVWRAQGVDRILRDVWERGGVLAGWSAGGCCWFDAFVTDSFGAELQPSRDGLGLLTGSFCPHFDSQPDRAPTFERLVRNGFPGGYAADDDAALVFDGTELREVVSGREGATGYRVTADGTERLAARAL